jgi:hypothetical protein
MKPTLLVFLAACGGSGSMQHGDDAPPVDAADVDASPARRSIPTIAASTALATSKACGRATPITTARPTSSCSST